MDWILLRFNTPAQVINIGKNREPNGSMVQKVGLSTRDKPQHIDILRVGREK